MIESWDFFKTISEKERLQIEDHITQFIDGFKKVSFSKGFGFDPFTLSDIRQYLLSPDQFEFRLKKERGKGLLYGSIHIQLRRHLFNALPRSLRIRLIIQKLHYFGLISKILYLHTDDALHFGKAVQLPDIVDVKDIGAAQSVYYLKLNKTPTSPSKFREKIVLKKEQQPKQSFYCNLLTEMGWPSFTTVHLEDNKGSWEISDYLGKRSVYEWIKNAREDQWEVLIHQLAKHAALGDILGLGDRHHDNYLMYRNTLYPIDVAILFWEGNEEWISKYIEGGKGEYSLFYLLESTPKQHQKSQALFWDIYKQSLQEIDQKQALIYDHIQAFFSRQSRDTIRKIQFIKTRLSNTKAYFQSQKKRYEAAYKVMQQNQKIKENFHAAVQKNPAILKDDILKMYYLADSDSLSAFFLAGEELLGRLPQTPESDFERG